MIGDVMLDGQLSVFDVLKAVRAQEQMVMAGEELTDAELIEKIRKAPIVLKPNVDAGPVVRCRDCKHRPTDNRGRDDDLTGFAIEFPDSRCPCQCEDGWYNWYPADDWFCGNGERRDE